MCMHMCMCMCICMGMHRSFLLPQLFAYRNLGPKWTTLILAPKKRRSPALALDINSKQKKQKIFGGRGREEGGLK